MKKQSGFTLIELVVAMAVLGLIMGAMVHLFGSSVTSLHVGARQEVVYEEARLLMNELKTTLRYADKDSIKYPEPDVLTYSGTMWDRHMDISQGNNKAYNIRVEWQKEIHKAISHLIIGKSKLISLETRVVFFNRQIPALINHRYGITDIRPVVTQ